MIAVDPRCSPTRSARWASTDLGPHQQPERGEDPAEDPRDRSLPGARRSSEHEVPGRGLAGQPADVAHLGRAQLRGDGPDLLLDGFEADQRVEFCDGALDGGRVLVPAQAAGELGERLLQVGGPDRDQVLARGLGQAGHDAHVTGLARLLEQAADEPSVAELVGDPAPAHLLEVRHSTGRASGSSSSPRRSSADSASAIISAGE